MKTKLIRLLMMALIAGAMNVSLVRNVSADAYSSSAYGACTYQTQDCPSGAGIISPAQNSATSNIAGAPNTGQEAISLLWPIVLGIIGFSIVSFVVTRYLNRDRAEKT